MNSRRNLIFRYAIIILYCTTASFILGCNKLVLNKFESTNQKAWLQYGGDPQKTNTSKETLSFPLNLAWKFNTPGNVDKSLISQDNTVFFGAGGGRIAGVNIKTGDGEGQFKLKKNKYASPVLYNGSLILFFRIQPPSIQKYDLLRGKIHWTINEGKLFSEPLVVGEHLYATYYNGTIACYNANNGELVWDMELETQFYATPSYAKQILLCPGNDGVLYAIKDKNILWKFETGGALRASASISNNTVYIGSTDGRLYALDITNGNKLWHFKTKGKLYNMVAVSDKFVILGSTDHHVYCLDKKTGTEKWTFEAKSVIGTAPVLTPNAVFIGSLDKHIYALDPETGKERWSFEAKGRIRTNPIIVNEKLLVASEEEKLYCFESHKQ